MGFFFYSCVFPTKNELNALKFLCSKAILNGGFMTQFPIHQYFGNSAQEFHGDETLSTPMKLLSSLLSLI
jgi:hypothetical protein